MPTAWTPWLAAAWITKLPQPQPTSSTRSPSRSASFLQISSRLAACACSSVGGRRSLRRMRSPRALQRVELAREQRAAVGHRLVEEQREELVRDVVVVAHRARVALAAVAPPARAQLAGGDRRRQHQPAGAHGRQRQPQPCPRVDRGRLERVEQPDHAVEVVRLQLAGGVRAAQPELSGRAQQVGDRGRGAHREDRSAGRGRRELRAVPEAQRERALRQRLRQLAAQWLRPGERHRACAKVVGDLRGGLPDSWRAAQLRT